MKRYIYILGIVALAMSLASCQKDDSSTIDPNAVHVSASIGDNVDSRSNPNGAESEDRMKFNDSDAISIQADDQGAIVHTLSGSTWAPTGNYLLWKSNEMTFSAFHPVSDGTSMTAFALPSDHSDVIKIATADYMTFTGLKTKGVVNLTFKRQTARVIVSIAEFGSSIVTQTVSDLMINSGIGEIGGTEIAPITPFVNGNGGVSTTYTALVLPTDNKAGESFITLKVDGSDLIVIDIPAHEAGYSYTYNLKVGREKIEVGSVTVAEWGTGKVIEGDTEKDPVVPPIDDSKYPTVSVYGYDKLDQPIRTHYIYVFDRNAGVDVPTSQDVPTALNWINTIYEPNSDAFAFKGDYYTWDQLFTGNKAALAPYLEGVVNEETNPCHLMGDGWRVPNLLELMSIVQDFDFETTDGKYITYLDNAVELTGNNGATCYLPSSGSLTQKLMFGAYWSSYIEDYGGHYCLYGIGLNPKIKVSAFLELHSLEYDPISVRCVKTVPSSVSDL